MPTSAKARAAKRPANRRTWAQRRLNEARTDEARVTVAYDWFRAELAACAEDDADTAKPAAWLTRIIWEAAAKLNRTSEETR